MAIRPVSRGDLPLLLTLIHELASIEEFPDVVSTTESDLERYLLGERPAAEAVIAWIGNEPAGFAVFYQSFATTTGRPGLHLDDLYVRPDHQGKGIGQSLLAYLARVARDRGCARFEWWALRWNSAAIGYYERLGARQLDEIQVFRLDEAGIARLADAGVDTWRAEGTTEERRDSD